MKKRVACLIAGVPSGYERCVAGLRQLLSNCSTDFYAVIREEFATSSTLQELERSIPGIRVIVVPSHVTEAAVSMCAHPQLLPTVIKMWHEIWYGALAFPRDRYDLVLRTRFDVFFPPQILPDDVPLSPRTIRIPKQLAWSGCNDMLCLAPPAGFMEYARTFERILQTTREGIFIPEMILARSLAIAGIEQESLDVNFILYRDALFSGFSDAQLSVLAHTRPDLSTYKLGGASDTEAHRKERIAMIADLTTSEARFPLLTAAMNGANFYAPEVDARDGVVYRWMGVHGKLIRPTPSYLRRMRFTIHHHVRGWDLKHLRVLVDGEYVNATEVGKDKYGRIEVACSLPESRDTRRGVMSFGSTFSQVPAASGENSRDHRLLSVAISDLAFM